MHLLNNYYYIPVAPSSSPTGVVTVTVSSTVIEILWNSLPFENRNGIVRYYIIRVNELQTGLTIQTNSTTESLSLGNLHPAYTYVVSVAAVTIERGPFSSTVTTDTDEDGMHDERLLCGNINFCIIFSSI